MTAYLIRRTIGMIIALWLVTMMLFFVMSFVPGDPITSRFGIDSGALDEEQVQILRKEYGLDRPLPMQYLSWVGSLLQGDLGESIQQRRPVTSILKERIPVTLQVQSIALLLSISLAIPGGIIAGLYQNRLPDRLCTGFALVGAALPSFWLGLMLIVLFSVQLGWIPVAAFTRVTDDPIEGLRTSILPAVTAAFAGGSALLLRQVRAGMVDVLNQDYVRTARAKGLRGSTVVTRHALRNAMLPVVTVLGLSIGHLLGGSVILERLFNIPGMGRLMIDAMAARDYPVVQGVALIIGITVVAATLATDIAYGRLDPRIRLR